MIKKLKLKNLFIIIEIVLFIIFFLFMPAQVNATNNEVLQTNPSVKAETSIIGDLGEDLRKRSTPGDAGNIVYQIMENTFYIKNAYSGRYMDVYRGIVADGTNVQQCGFNGGDNKKWYINYNGDGTFSILSQINSNYALDVYGASGDNYANIGIWSHHDGDAQKFKIFYTDTSTYIIKTKISNYEKAVVVHANGCSDEDNINQYTYSNNWNELWILEPVTRNI